MLQDGDAMAEVSDQRHGVRDEEIGKTVALLEVAEQVDDLCADGDIECADGLVEDEEFGAEGDGAGDVDALALASGELVGIAAEGGGVEADLGQELVEARLEALWGRFAMDGEGLGEDLVDRHAWIEGGIGVLKDDGEAAAETAHLAGFQLQEIVDAGIGVARVVEEDAAAGGLDEAEQEAGDGALAGAGLAYQAEGFAAHDVEGDAVDDARGAEIFDEVAGFEQGFGGHAAPAARVPQAATWMLAEGDAWVLQRAKALTQRTRSEPSFAKENEAGPKRRRLQYNYACAGCKQGWNEDGPCGVYA